MTSFHCKDVQGHVTAPPSKSHTHRAIFIASLAEGESVLRGPLLSDDTLRSIDAVRGMGADVIVDDDIRISGCVSKPSDVYAGNSGTTARFAVGVASVFDGTTTVDGDASLRKRPMDGLANALSSMGVGVSYDGRLPMHVRGPNKGGDVEVSGNISSQFVSALLIPSPLFPNGLVLRTDLSVSRYYVDMTMDVMRAFGADVVMERDITVKNTGYRASDITIPGDASSAAFMMAAGALGGSVTVDIDPSVGGDMRIAGILKDIGADVDIGRGSVTVSMNEVRSIDIDLSDNPDLVPVLAAVLSVADGTSMLRNISHLRHKESDRLESVTDMIKSLGGHAYVHGNDMMIDGGGLNGGSVDSHGDHRIAMAAAVASAVTESPVTIDCDCSSISYPNFIEHMRSIGYMVV